jgi:hypothetical protein
LHKEQLVAYQEAAEQALILYARTFSLPVATKKMDPTVLVQQCLETVIDKAPTWKVSRASLVSLVHTIVTERALQAYQLAHPATKNDSHNSETKLQSVTTTVPEEEDGDTEVEFETAEEEIEEGEEKEDGYEDEPDQDESSIPEDSVGLDNQAMTAEENDEGTKAPDSGLALKRRGILAKKRADTAAARGLGKTAPRKKNEKVKAVGPKPGRGRGRPARRGGRGGSNVK